MINETQQTIKASAALAGGISLLFSPWWTAVLAEVSFLASVIAAVAGAIIGVASIWRMVRIRKG